MKNWLFVLSILTLVNQSHAESSHVAHEVTAVVSADTLIIKMADAGIIQPVEGLNVTLQDETTGSSQILPYDQKTMSARVVVNTDHRYTIAIDAPGYIPYRKYIAQIQPGQELSVSLQKKSIEAKEKKYIFIVTDKEQHSVVPNAEVLVFDEAKKPVPGTVEKGRFVVMHPESGEFNYQVTAKEYNPASGRLERTALGIVEVGLSRREDLSETQTIAFIAQDAFTKKPVAARFRLNSSEITTSATVTTAQYPQFGTELKLKQPYLLEVKSDGYEKYSAPITLETKEAEPIKPRIILLDPLEYEVNFVVLDATSMNPVDPASFKIGEAGKSLNLRNAVDSRKVSLIPGKQYAIRVGQPGYEVFERTLTFDKPTHPNDLLKTILLSPVKTAQTAAVTSPAPEQKPLPAAVAARVDETMFENLKVGEAVRLDNVYFDQSSYILRAESYPQLDKLVKTLKVNSKLKIEIGGHTDNVGDARLNQFLSENRAKVISSYLTNHGIPDGRLVWKGYGQTKPIAENDTEENKAQNRRVEFVVLEN